MYYSFALAGHRGTCLRPLHIFALLCKDKPFGRNVDKTQHMYAYTKLETYTNLPFERLDTIKILRFLYMRMVFEEHIQDKIMSIS